ncbi:MAG: (2Fe-2S)-binding protein, partial [Planctomycetes bacterium]|nr:(2Fe-2S)-binding protein [Planctomycetota bacterium]
MIAVKIPVKILVNGMLEEREVEPRTLLVQFLRDECGLTGTHVGCETTICGACTVLLDRQAVKSCTVLAVQADGCEVTTIEGLAQDGRLHPVQEGFWERHGLQCGYCTPGMLLAATALLDRNDDPTEEEVRSALSGNLCRCTGYMEIVAAVLDAARRRRGGSAIARRDGADAPTSGRYVGRSIPPAED